MAFLSLFMISLLGLVIDSVRLYVLSAQAERAAESAALAAALYMPTYFSESSPAPDGQSAEKRACDVLKQNGITSCLVSAGQIGGQVSTVATNQYEVQVTVTLQANIFFLGLVSPNLATANVTRSALAEFLPTIELGSRFPYFGDQSSADATTVGGKQVPLQNFWAFINGPSELQEHGDAYTPTLQEGPTDPINYPDGGNNNCIIRWNPPLCGTTNHQQYGQCKNCPIAPIANPDQQPPGFTGQDGKPGYNYQIVIPKGAPSMELQIYNPAFDPTNGTTTDGLDSACLDPAFGSNGTCTKTDAVNEYMQLTYYLYSAPVQFERSQDTWLTTFQAPSLDVDDSSTSVGGSGAHCQGTPSTPYWDPQKQACAADPGYINKWKILPDKTGAAPLLLGPGTYRLVVEATGFYGRHGYGLKLTNAATGLLPPSNSGYGVWGWNDSCLHFNTTGTNTSFDLGEIPAAYAGKTLDFSLFDPGDVSGGTISMSILDPSGTAVQVPSWVTTVNNDGTDINASNMIYNGLWLHMPIPIPANYNPAQGQDWWQINYKTTGTPSDTLTITISLTGSPIHLISEIP